MADIEYPRGEGKKKYLSRSKHMANAHNKYSKWLSVNIERMVFDIADNGSFENPCLEPDPWIDDNRNMWGFLDGLLSIGTKNEQFGYFENPGNPVNHWHGFPIIPFSGTRYDICPALIRRWIIEGHLDEEDIPTLYQRRRIR